MYTLQLALQGGDYVAIFRGKENATLPLERYYSISIKTTSPQLITHHSFGCSLKLRIEVCEIEHPQTMTFYTLKSNVYRCENLFEYLCEVLVNYGAVTKGTPVEICYEQKGVHHSRIVVNAGEKQSETVLESVQKLYIKCLNIVSRSLDELAKGNTEQSEVLKQEALFIAGRVIPSMVSYNPFKPNVYKYLWRSCQKGIQARYPEKIEVCGRCNTPVSFDDVPEQYYATCPNHDEDLFRHEVVGKPEASTLLS
ncbi:hypothetical protein L1D14_07440 [Vibrio tubiashii]|uniref:hypothetical protein n=1 Tax=Vibrio tubiashii TaxID=29498 RepID=UPI001EFD2BA2|nr:hypothetical protein [Vibrio tubiashii]MCG9576071.1 hypothetical protein [Vibrio tubiashii]